MTEKKDEAILNKFGWMQWFNIIEVLLAIILGAFLSWVWLLLMCLVFVRFAMVQEGTAKVITRFGGIVKVLLQWTGYKLSKDDDVEEKTGLPQKRLLGGLYVWLGTPFDKEHTYRLRWHSIEERKGEILPIPHDERLNSVMVKVDAYWRKIKAVETKDGQYPDEEYLIRMRSINPRKTISRAPYDWVENALTVLMPLLVSYNRTKSLKEFLGLTSEEIWNDIGNDYTIQTVLKEEWGILVEEKGIEKLAVNLPPDYQKALAEKSRAEMEAEAAQRKMEIEAKARASETVGTLIAMIHEETGIPTKKIQKEFRGDPKAFIEKHKDVIERNIDLLQRKLAIEGKAFVDIRVQGAEGVEKAILNILAALKRMPEGKEEKEGKEGKKKPSTDEGDEEKDEEKSEGKKRKRIEDMTKEEARESIEEAWRKGEKAKAEETKS